MTFRRFLFHLIAMAIFILVVVLGVLIWLRVYTHHGQKLELPDYSNLHIDEARKNADLRSFQIIVNDSLFKVGMEGGIILNQNPVPGSQVKQNRKVYVDITRYSATTNKLADLPVMYGREYGSVRRSLSHLEIDTDIKSYKYDAGEADHILEVWYKGELVDGKEGRMSNVEIETGDKLEFVLSKKEGGKVVVPDLVCQMVGNAKWRLKISKLKLGRIEKRGFVSGNLDSAYVVSQFPAYNDSVTISMGDPVNILIQQERPEDCQ